MLFLRSVIKCFKKSKSRKTAKQFSNSILTLQQSQSFIQTDINVSRLSCPGTEAREFGTKHITWKGTHVHEADIADTSNQWCSFWALNMVKNFVRYTGRWKFFLIKKRTQKNNRLQTLNFLSNVAQQLAVSGELWYPTLY